MRVRITQFTDVERVKERLILRFGARHSQDAQVDALLSFLDDAKARMDRMQSVNASIHLRKEFKVRGKHVSVTAGTVHGLLPSLWARLTS